MATKYIPDNLKGDKAQLDIDKKNVALDKALLTCIVNGLHRIELQLEKLTGEKIDQDDGTLL